MKMSSLALASLPAARALARDANPADQLLTARERPRIGSNDFVLKQSGHGIPYHLQAGTHPHHGFPKPETVQEKSGLAWKTIHKAPPRPAIQPGRLKTSACNGAARSLATMNNLPATWSAAATRKRSAPPAIASASAARCPLEFPSASLQLTLPRLLSDRSTP